ncbi:uncharacterized protein LOC128160278 [Crassostrea angulata]|nr:uncharacterized protein LOC109619659 [Crassostrea gigas]XP_052672989.1 uncharacterized protein LOC128155358 [Crassostrea angulata]XP_052679531.1 uncharacterized protein LOC128160278 [Crassostrea angulata]|eukprot:XP_019925796.1 PREDICTED: uncharacterized protein LOC109619659 [Crassostrea gigas]
MFTKARDLEMTTGAIVKMAITGPSGTKYVYGEDDFVVSEGQSKATTHVATQTEEQHMITNSKMCRVCGEGELATRVRWIGCDGGTKKRDCEYWCHCHCLGFRVKTQAALSRLQWFCPAHRSEAMK